MYAEYKRDVSHNYLILREDEKVNTASYQVRMLTGNVIPSILKCRIQGLDGNLLFYYDITSRQSLASFYEQRKFHSKDLHMLFGGFIRVMEEMAEFLMNTDQLLLCPEYIFLDIEKREVKFCCLPDYHHPIQEQFRELTEYLLPRLDHEDPLAVSMGYGVYRKAMETGFQLEHIKEAIYQNREATGKNDNKESAQKQEQKLTGNNLDGVDNFGEEIQKKTDVSQLLKTDMEDKTSKRKDKKKEESVSHKSANEWTAALLCVSTAAVMIILLILRYLGYLPGIPAEAIFGGAIILLALAAFLSWTAEKKKQKKQMSAEWRQKVQRELADTKESDDKKKRAERNSENLYDSCFYFIQNLFFHFISQLARFPCQSDLVSLVTRNQMHMEMKYGLSCNLAIVLHDIKSVTVQSISEFCCHFFCKNHCFRCGFIRKFINIGSM
jgi:hypothetical protein